MSLGNLWAGWRAEYVASVSDHSGLSDALETFPHADVVGEGQSNNCVFCRILAADEGDEERAIVHWGTTCVALLNAFPYASGHMLIMPRRHVDDLANLTEEESGELWEMTMQAATAARSAYEPEGLNIGANLGRAAGAGIPAHLHLHVVPRWVGDTNFMTTVASVRVMPEPLSLSWRKLHDAWPS